MSRRLLAGAGLLIAALLPVSFPRPAPAQDDEPAAQETPAGRAIEEPESHTNPGLLAKRRAQKDLRTGRADPQIDAAVRRALRWLDIHRDPKGFWDCDGFEKRCRLNRCGGPGRPEHDAGVTGLALLAFLGTGENPFDTANRDVVRAALGWMLERQDPRGCYPPRISGLCTYDHAICTMAMAEAYGLCGSPTLVPSLEKAVAFIGGCQNPYLAWRYGVRPGDNSTSVTAWMVTALFTARAVGIEVPDAGFEGALAWLGKVTEPEYGRVGYTSSGSGVPRAQDLMEQFPADRSEATTAMGLFSRVLIAEAMGIGKVRSQEVFAKGCELLEKCLPEWSESRGTIDMIYWHFGTLVACQEGHDLWKKWKKPIREAILEHQRRDGDQNGSWDPCGPWGRDGGRVYSTAITALTLETGYRYPPLAE